MKKSYLTALCLSLGTAALSLFTGCGGETPQIPPSDNLRRITNPITTPSTYTGTTVEYVPQSQTARRNNSFDMPEMPEFPAGEFPETDNPFGREFYELFGGDGAVYPDYSVAAEDDSSEQLTGTETSPGTAGYSDISVSREDVPREAMTDIAPDVRTARVENPFGDMEMPAYEFSDVTVTAVTVPAETAEEVTAGTMPVTRGFDIGDYMPDDIEFPDFGEIEFDTADFNR